MLLVILSAPEIASVVIARRPKADVAISYPSKDGNSGFTFFGKRSRIAVRIMMITAFLPIVGIGVK